MKRTAWLVLLAWPGLAQLPPSTPLSGADQRAFDAEIARVEALLSSAPDKAAVEYQLARTWALGKQWPQAVEWLQKVADLKVGLDPSRDAAFAALRGTREFAAIDAEVRFATPPVYHSTPAFTIAEGDLVPESVAYDTARKRFLFGSMTKGKVIACSSTGICSDFATGLGTVLGLKVSGDSVWLVSNSENESALLHLDLASARLVRKYAVAGREHSFNDLAIAPSGEVYVTDTRAGAVWRLAKGAAELARLPGGFEGANGIAISPRGDLVYVSTFPDGITILDLKTNITMPIQRPGGLCLVMIDGLAFYRGELIAIQNGFMTPRVVRLKLRRDLRAIERWEILERRNPLFDGITSGVVAGGQWFYMANIQDEKKTGFLPITILKAGL